MGSGMLDFEPEFRRTPPDIAGFGASMRQAFEGQIALFPHMMNPEKWNAR